MEREEEGNSNDRRGLRFAIIGWLIVTRGNNVISVQVGNATSKFHLLQSVVSIQVNVSSELIVFLPSSIKYRLSTINYQVSIVKHQVSSIKYQQ